MNAARIKVAGAYNAAAVRAAAPRAKQQCAGSGDFSNADYLGPAAGAGIALMGPAQDTTFTMTALNMPFMIRQLQISVSKKAVIAVKSITIAGVEYLLNGEILADYFDPKAEPSSCPINLPTCPLQINQSVVVTLYSYDDTEFGVFGGVMARGFT